jgi:hypothetical protein
VNTCSQSKLCSGQRFFRILSVPGGFLMPIIGCCWAACKYVIQICIIGILMNSWSPVLFSVIVITLLHRYSAYLLRERLFGCCRQCEYPFYDLRLKLSMRVLSCSTGFWCLMFGFGWLFAGMM